MYLSSKIIGDLCEFGYSQSRRYIYYVQDNRVVRVPPVPRPSSPVPRPSSLVLRPSSLVPRPSSLVLR